MTDLPGYGNLQDIGGGGFSRVYRADDTRHSRTVAIKILNTRELSDQEQIAFERELNAMGKIGNHPHVVTVLDSGFTVDGNPFLVMPFYENGTFSARLRNEGALPVKDAIEVAIKIACALETAHREGIVHRDVKPENIFFGEFGAHALGDFGISSFVDAGQASKTVGVAMTPSHAAPEVLEDERPTKLTDVYSLGSTLYSLLAGGPAFSADSFAGLIRKVLSEDPPAFRRTDVPPTLNRLVRRMMAKQPVDRPESCLAAAEQLRTIQLDHGWAPTEITVRGWNAPTEPPEQSFDPSVTVPRNPENTASADHDDKTYVPSELGRMVTPVRREAPKPRQAPPKPTPTPKQNDSDFDAAKTAFRSGMARPQPAGHDTAEARETDLDTPPAPSRSLPASVLVGLGVLVLITASVVALLTRSGVSDEVGTDPADLVDQELDPDDVAVQTLPSDPTDVVFTASSGTPVLQWLGRTGPNIVYEIRVSNDETLYSTEERQLDLIAAGWEAPTSGDPVCAEVRVTSKSPARVGEWVGPACLSTNN